MALVTSDENASRLAAEKRLATASSFSVSPVKGLPRCRSEACRKLNGIGLTVFQLEFWHKCSGRRPRYRLHGSNNVKNQQEQPQQYEQNRSAPTATMQRRSASS